jgi:transcription elongation factor Elf1
MGRKRQKVVKVIRRRLPSQYLCPNCGKNTITVVLKGDEKIGRVMCASCNLRSQFPIPSNIEPVDAYCLFVDKYYGVEEEPVQVE